MFERKQFGKPKCIRSSVLSSLPNISDQTRKVEKWEWSGFGSVQRNGESVRKREKREKGERRNKSKKKERKNKKRERERIREVQSNWDSNLEVTKVLSYCLANHFFHPRSELIGK